MQRATLYLPPKSAVTVRQRGGKKEAVFPALGSGAEYNEIRGCWLYLPIHSSALANAPHKPTLAPHSTKGSRLFVFPLPSAPPSPPPPPFLETCVTLPTLSIAYPNTALGLACLSSQGPPVSSSCCRYSQSRLPRRPILPMRMGRLGSRSPRLCRANTAASASGEKTPITNGALRLPPPCSAVTY